MATAAEIRQRVFDYLYGSFPTESPFATTLAASYTSGATTITVLDEDNWAPQDIVENPGTGEQMLVVGVTTNDTNVLTVIRGFAGTTAAASAGTDDLLYKNPRFSVKKVDDAVTTCLGYLENLGVHVFGNGTITRADPKKFYELTETDIVLNMGVLRVYEFDSNDELPRTLPFRYQFNLGTDAASLSGTGTGVYVQDWGQTANGSDVYFSYAQRIDDVTNLLGRQEELVVLGAVVILLGGTVIPATHDPGQRTDRTTQPGQTSRDVRHFQGRFFMETRQEAANLTLERQKLLHEPTKFARARRWVN
jgi:hypothetical protein